MEEILDLIPQAVLIVDWGKSSIIIANALATELTAFMRSELVGIRLGELLSCKDPDTSLKEALQYTSSYMPDNVYQITTRNGSKVDVLATGTVLGNSNWMLISLTAKNEIDRKQSEEQRQHKIWQQIEQMAFALQSNDLENALQTILEVGCQITGADIAAVYLADGELLKLVRISAYGDVDSFPEKTNPQDLMNVNENPIWVRRMHPITTLQNHARQSGYAYLACSLLGQPYARVGMIILAGKKSPPNILSEAIPTISSFASVALETLTNVANYQERIRDQNIEIAVANKIKDLIHDNLILLTPDLTISDINLAAEKTLGYSAREAVNQPIDKIMICSEPLERLYKAAIRGENPIPLEDIKLFRRYGESFSANIKIIPCDIVNEGIGVGILFQDLSERDRIHREKEVLEQRAVLGEVTASFAHEVRNPINNISTGLQLLESNIDEDDPNQENIKRLQQDCDRLTALIKSGLSFIRPMEYQNELVQLGKLVENLANDQTYRLNRSNIQLQSQIDEPIPQVEGDRRALEQVFNNLINNAIDSMKNSPADRPRILGIKASQLRDNGNGIIQVSISDTGIGISEDIKDRIFEPFFTTKTGGTGIGLAIVKRIVTAHKGSITVESVPGATVFQVQIPIYTEKTQPLSEAVI
jgi:PAS domain S-box-containing protein